jgi:hypothetical protein
MNSPHRKLWAVTTVLLATLLFLAPVAAQETAASSPRAETEKKPESKEPKKETSDITDIVDKLEYPELQVVPRASQRLKIEAAEEDRNWFYAHWTLEVSGLATLATGMTSDQRRENLNENDVRNAQNFSSITKAIGAGWFVTGLFLGFQQPYRSASKVIAHTSSSEKGERAALLKERLAEEALERPAKTMRVLSWVSVLTNVAANGVMLPFMTDQGRILGGFSLLLSFLPWMFEDHSIEVYDKHIEYKKKIYGPLSSLGVGYDSRGHEAYPTTLLTWNF